MPQYTPRLVLLDLDGTLYVGNQAIPGAVESVAQLRRRGFILRFLTNTTTKSQSQLVAQLRALRFELDDAELVSAPVAAALELQRLQEKMDRPLRIWPVVAEAIKEDFSKFTLDQESPDYIVLGDIGDRWDYPLINRLFTRLHAGAKLIALHKNRFWQTEQGLNADIGFFVAGFEYICSTSARVMGKPNPDFFQSVLTSVGIRAQDALMVGDDIDSDIGGAQLSGMRGCLVKTGKYRQSYADQSNIVPDYWVDSVAGLVNLFDATQPASK